MEKIICEYCRDKMAEVETYYAVVCKDCLPNVVIDGYQ